MKAARQAFTVCCICIVVTIHFILAVKPFAWQRDKYRSDPAATLKMIEANRQARLPAAFKDPRTQRAINELEALIKKAKAAKAAKTVNAGVN